MRAPRLTISFLLLGCIVGGWAAWRLETEITHFRIKIDHDKSTAGAGLDAAKKTEADLKAQLTALQAPLAKPAAPKTSAGASAPGAMDAQAKRAALITFAKTWLEAGSAPMYAHLERSLGLSEAQVDQLKDLNAQRFVDAFNAMREVQKEQPKGSKPDPATVAAAIAPAIADSEKQMQQILGNAGFQQFQEQTKLAPAEAMVQQMTINLGSAAAQMSEVQKDQLAQALTENQPSGPGQMGMLDSLSALNPNRGVQITDAALTQAANVLSPDQLAVVREYQAEAQAKKTVTRIQQEQFAALGKTAAAQKSP